MSLDFLQSITRSALWAAYGDAVGFPTELVSQEDFRKRNSLNAIERPIAWRRRVGGLFGPEIPFEAGVYSDDTQLRLSTCRAIRGNGFFDVESFAKIELPVWLNYSLGAGRGSKMAAANLALRESTWSQNFYRSAESLYTNGGGNGAAMRIQPHVWQSHQSDYDSFYPDVIRNSVCTHGHPRALIGSAIHAAFLFETMQSQRLVPPSRWAELGEDAAAKAFECIQQDEELSLVWIPSWEQMAGRKLDEAWAETIVEWVKSASDASHSCLNAKDPEATYRHLLSTQGGFSNAERGSGIKTVLFSIALPWLYQDSAPEAALLASANAFKSDTDTVATMAGAIIGLVAKTDPPGPIQDEGYIRGEARRIFDIGAGKKADSFTYPDLLDWTAPKSQTDAWVQEKDKDFLSGLGRLEAFGEEWRPRKGTDIIWQWARLEFGQTILSKRRGQVKAQHQRERPAPSPSMPRAAPTNVRNVAQQHPIFEPHELMFGGSLDEITQQCIRSGFDPTFVGAALLSLCVGPNSIDRAIGFAAIIAKAKVARAK